MRNRREIFVFGEKEVKERKECRNMKKNRYKTNRRDKKVRNKHKRECEVEGGDGGGSLFKWCPMVV